MIYMAKVQTIYERFIPAYRFDIPFIFSAVLLGHIYTF